MINNRCICTNEMQLTKFSTQFDAWECSRCGCKHFVPSVENIQSEFKYDETSDKYADQSYLNGKQMRWSHFKLLEKDWADRRVLEIGCFNGFFLDELQKMGADVYGYDVNSQAVTVGMSLFKLKNKLTSDFEVISKNAPYDDIICIDLVEHLDDPFSFVEQMKTLMKPEGKIYISGPILERKLHDKSDYPPHHKWWFSLPGMSAFLKANQLTVTETVVQYDGYLFARNFISKLLNGYRNKEYFGDEKFPISKLGFKMSKVLHPIAQTIGSKLFKIINKPYCSCIMIGQKSSKH